jgi:hypothetical protein
LRASGDPDAPGVNGPEIAAHLDPRYSRSTEAIPLRSSAEMPACRACNHTVSPLDNRRLPTIQSPGCDTELMPSAETAGSSKKEL